MKQLKKFEDTTHSSGMAVEVYLPRVSLESDFDLAATLKTMGLNKIFDPTEAKLFNSSDIYVTKLFHKSRLEINENWAMAAGVTGEHRFLSYIYQINSVFFLFVCYYFRNDC